MTVRTSAALLVLSLVAIASCSLAPARRTTPEIDFTYGDGKPEDVVIPSPSAVYAAPEDPPEPTPVSREQIVFDDMGYTGDAARAILRPEPYTEIVVEIDYVEGWPPDQQARAYLADGLRRVTRKKVSFEGGNAIPSPTGDMTSIQQIRALSATRDVVSAAPKVALWILYLDGSFRESEFTYGVSLNATIVALFPEHFRLFYAADSPQSVEMTVLLHEVGHLLGMTNYGYETPRDHHDRSHPGHNRLPGSVMHWKAEGATITDIVTGSPLSFDDNDLADMADLRAGRL